ncbi:MAG TPA: glycosyltransferase family 2 protein [Candidatus Cloacimonadota bacterium]|nr:glycosyltransferase family 2 protein [Candidatus Cloacimonadota bacterium]HPS38833.1 glycosyltransferase family 2 protein [Candidatus Cloacimonadota bacterium]
MKIEVFAICYNEEILLPYFLRHYSRFADRITIYDNYSTDCSPEICRINPRVNLVQYDSGNQIRDDIYLDIKNNCWKGSTADWVIVCDIDEFVLELFAPTPIDDYTVIMPDWWEMVGERIPSGPGQIYEEISQGVCLGQASKCVMFRPSAIKEINYAPGAHSVSPVGDFRLLQTSQMGLLHFKNISLDYVVSRHALLASRLSDINKRNNWGFHYEQSAQVIGDYYRSLLEKRQSIWKDRRNLG